MIGKLVCGADGLKMAAGVVPGKKPTRSTRPLRNKRRKDEDQK